MVIFLRPESQEWIYLNGRRVEFYLTQQVSKYQTL